MCSEEVKARGLLSVLGSLVLSFDHLGSDDGTPVVKFRASAFACRFLWTVPTCAFLFAAELLDVV